MLYLILRELREVTAYDELELDTLGDRKTALFLIMSDTDDSFNFLISMCYTQLFNLLCEKADDVYGGRLPVHVRCLIDECANIGQIPKLEKLVATIRSREISACLVLQAQSPAQSHLQGQCRYHHRKYGYFHLFGRQGADHLKGIVCGAGERDHRHLQYRREPWAGNLPLAQLSKIGGKS